jgi:hypothetical protein
LRADVSVQTLVSPAADIRDFTAADHHFMCISRVFFQRKDEIDQLLVITLNISELRPEDRRVIVDE